MLVLVVSCAPPPATNDAAPAAASPVLTAAQIRAAAIAKHTAALHSHNTDNVYWAYVPKPTPPPTPKQIWDRQLMNHNTNDIYWALPAAMRPAANFA